MDKDFIAVNIHPFVFKQEVSVCQNGSYIRSIKCKLDDLPKTILTLSDMYHIDKVNLVDRNNIYKNKIKDDLSMLLKFKNKKLDIVVW